jgi:hypothetical protein
MDRKLCGFHFLPSAVLSFDIMPKLIGLAAR